MERVTFNGVLLCATEADWEMTNGGTGEIRRGTTHDVWLASAFLKTEFDQPIRVTCSDDQLAEWHQLVEAGPGADVEVVYAIVLQDFEGQKAKNVRKLLKVHAAAPAGTKANGSGRRRQLAAT